MLSLSLLWILERRGDRPQVTAESKSQRLYYLYWSIPLAYLSGFREWYQAHNDIERQIGK